MSRIQPLHRRALSAALLMAAVVLAAGPAAAQSPLAVKLWTSRGNDGVYEPGDEIEISARVNRDASLLVYEIDAEGAVHLLFPTRPDDADVPGGQTLRLPESGEDRLVVEGPVGEGYIVAIAAYDGFRELPWYLRPRDPRADEMGYADEDDNESDGVTHEGRIVGDPFVAMERIRRKVLADPSDTHSFATTYATYYVHQEVRYPRYLCYDCHRSNYWSWWDGFDPYYSSCSVFQFRITANWWWGPTYWTGSVPYYAYVYRTDCPPRYRPHGTRDTWFSSWDGWRRWTDLWGGPLRRYKSSPPAGYVPPAKWDRTNRDGFGASLPLPPGYMASAHDGQGRAIRDTSPWKPPAGAGSGDRSVTGSGRVPRDVPVGGRWEPAKPATPGERGSREWRGSERGAERGSRDSREYGRQRPADDSRREARPSEQPRDDRSSSPPPRQDPPPRSEPRQERPSVDTPKPLPPQAPSDPTPSDRTPRRRW